MNTQHFIIVGPQEPTPKRGDEIAAVTERKDGLLETERVYEVTEVISLVEVNIAYEVQPISPVRLGRSLLVRLRLKL